MKKFIAAICGAAMLATIPALTACNFGSSPQKPVTITQANEYLNEFNEKIPNMTNGLGSLLITYTQTGGQQSADGATRDFMHQMQLNYLYENGSLYADEYKKFLDNDYSQKVMWRDTQYYSRYDDNYTGDNKEIYRQRESIEQAAYDVLFDNEGFYCDYLYIMDDMQYLAGYDPETGQIRLPSTRLIIFNPQTEISAYKADDVLQLTVNINGRYDEGYGVVTQKYSFTVEVYLSADFKPSDFDDIPERNQ